MSEINKTNDKLPPMAGGMKFLLNIPVLVGIGLTTWYLFILDLGIAAGIFAVTSAILFPVRYRVNKKHPGSSLPKAISLFLFISACASLSTLIYVATRMEPTASLIILILVVIAFAVEHRLQPRIPPSALLLLITFGLTIHMWNPLLLGLPVSAVILQYLRWFKPAYMPRGVNWLLCLIIGTSGAIVVPFSWGIPQSDKQAIAGQQNAKIIYDATDKGGPHYKHLGNEVAFGAYDCNGDILIGSRTGPSGLARISDGETQAAKIEPLGGNIGVDCKRRQLYIGAWNSGYFYVLDHDTLKIKEKVERTRIYRTTALTYNKQVDRVYVACDFVKRLFIYKPPTRRWTWEKIEGFGIDLAVVPQHNLLATTSWGGKLYLYDLDTFKVTGRLRFADMALRLWPGSGGDSLWIAATYTGRQFEYSLPGMRLLRKSGLIRGNAFIHESKSGGEIYMGDYVHGEISILEGRSLAVKDILTTGRHLRNLNYFPDNGALLGASAYGLVELKAGHQPQQPLSSSAPSDESDGN